MGKWVAIGVGLLGLASLSNLSAQVRNAGPTPMSPLVLDTLRWEKLGEGLRLEIDLPSRLDYRVGHLKAPERIYVDLLGAVFTPDRIAEPLMLDSPLVQRIRFGRPGPQVARIVIDLTQPVRDREYFLSDPLSLLIELRPPTPPGAADAAVPGGVGSAAPGPAVAGVILSPGSEGLQVRLPFAGKQLEGQGQLEHPNRFYVDLKVGGEAPPLLGRSFAVGGTWLESIRGARNRPGVLRVVLDLPEGVLARLEPVSPADPVVVRLARSGSALDATVTSASGSPPPVPSAPLPIPAPIRVPVSAPLPPVQPAGPKLSPAGESPRPVRQDGNGEADSPGPVGERRSDATAETAPERAPPPAELLPDESTTAEAEVLDEIVARVQDDYITRRDLETREQLLEYELAQREAAGEAVDKEREQRQASLLEEAIELRLMKIRSEELGFGPEANQLLATFLAKTKAEAGLTDDAQLEQVLKLRNLSLVDYQAMVREKLLAEVLLRHQVYFASQVLESEVLDYFQHQEADFLSPAEVELAELFIPDSKAPSSRAAVGPDEIRAALDRGEPWEELTAKYSTGPTSRSGGRLGVFVVGDLDTRLQEFLADLPEGGVSQPIEVEGGTQFLKIVRRLPRTRRSYAEVAQEIRAHLEAARREQKLENLRRQLWKEAFIEVNPRYRGKIQRELPE